MDNADVAEKKKRSKNFCISEIRVFTDIILPKYKEIIESRKSDAITRGEKARAWKDLTVEFNSASHFLFRTEENLKNLWDKQKKDARKSKTHEHTDTSITGGGTRSSIEDTSEVGILNRFDDHAGNEEWTHSNDEFFLRDEVIEKELSGSPKRKIMRMTESSEDRLASAAMLCLQNEDDDYIVMVKSYLAKLKKLSPQQLLFADRVINETLLDARLGKLTRWTTLSHDGHYPRALTGSENSYYNNFNAAHTFPGTPSSTEQLSEALSFEEDDVKLKISHIT